MKILIVNASDIEGGAARAAYRLHRSLRSEGVNSLMLVQSKASDDVTVTCATTKIDKLFSKLRPILDSLPFRFYSSHASTLFSSSWLPSGKLVDRINKIKPDVVHLHWVNAGMIRIEDLAKINAPIVWSLHDMWPFSGGWHYREPLSSNAQGKLDQKILKRKLRAYSKIKNMTIVGLSRWLQKCAKDSVLFRENNVINLPNPIDTAVYKPINKKTARELWQLPDNKKLVLFGAMGATSDPRKGFKELIGSLNLISRDDIEFVIFGSSEPINPPKLGCKVHYVGTLSDDVSLVSLYSAVDIMVVPSLQENLSNAIMESLSCATPVVGFDIGGNSDLIDHKSNGYLCKPFDILDLAKGIEWLIDYDAYNELCLNSRSKVMRDFEATVVANKYINVYKNILIGSEL